MENNYPARLIKKVLFPFLFICFSSLTGYSQFWWHPLNTGITGDYGILTEATYNGELYVGGWFYRAGNVTANNIARWSGWNWDSVGSGLTGGINNVETMCVYNGKLYVGGGFYAADKLAANNIAVWDGSHWDTLGRGIRECGGGFGWADAMAVYNGKLYVAGAFCHAGGIKAFNIACWDGTKWDSVAAGINDSVYALAVYNGKLYAAGQFTWAGGQSVNNIACWDGTKWNAVGTGTNEPIFALATYNGSLYAGGSFFTAGGNTARSIATWNGAKWSAVGAGLIGGSGVSALCVFNNQLYAGGLFNKSGSLTVNNIATWNGTVWDTVSTQGVDYIVDAFAVMDSAVYAGGEFTHAGNIAASDIAAWGGPSLGLNSPATKNAEIDVYPNPGNGKFTIQVTNSSSLKYVAIYNILGEKIYSTTYQPSVTEYQLCTINISTQPPGIYLYRMLDQSENLIGQGKLLVK